jgi:arsenite-transporting ATPase
MRWFSFIILDMDLDEFMRPRLHILLGKGGVGKTTVAAALGTAAAERNLDSLICETEGKSGLGSIFSRGALGYEQEELLPHLWARTIKPDEALIQYLEDHSMFRLSKYLVRANLLEYVSTTIPGIKDVLILGKVKQLVYRNRDYERPYEVIVLDPPAAGHALTFLSSPLGIRNAVRMGPLLEQSEEVLELLANSELTVVHVVTLPEETPVNEALEAAEKVVERTGCRLGVVFVNGCYPRPHRVAAPEEVIEAAREVGTEISTEIAEGMAAASAFLAERYEMQQAEKQRVAEKLGLPTVELPFLFTTDISVSEIKKLASALVAGVEAIR